MSLGKTALKYAIAELGKQEIPLGSNWGPHVKKYLASVGLNFPASWCAGFVYWCFEQAAKEKGVPNPLYKTGGVLKMWQNTDKKYRVYKDPQPGDIGILDYGKGLGHTYIVEKVDATFTYNVEGNTNDTGSREGIETCRKQRPRKNPKLLGYLRLP